MLKRCCVYLQYLLPKQLITIMVGWLANTTNTTIKNLFITLFIKKYRVDMSAAEQEDPTAYPTFNAFFTRRLKPHLRPIANDSKTIISPADGCLAQFGEMNKNLLLQAKGFYFDLETLLANQHDLAANFYNGTFMTFYLAPRDYHRFHMPLAGQLTRTIYVPGHLFSVNRMTSELIPQLYSRNERLICEFKTEAGQVLIILVGALIVGSIQTVWMDAPIRHNAIQDTAHTNGIYLNKGDELGQFQLGSTVLLLFQKNKMKIASPPLTLSSNIYFGQTIGSIF